MKSLLAWMKGNVGSIECYMEFFCLKFHPIHQEFMVSLQTFLLYALNNMLECMVKVRACASSMCGIHRKAVDLLNCLCLTSLTSQASLTTLS